VTGPNAVELLVVEDLKQTGLRVTAPRLAVLVAVRQGGHRTVEELAASARGRLGTVSTQAVYDVLGALAAAGLVRRIEPPGGPARFEARVGDNHHHLICRVCGCMQDVDCAVASGPCLELPAVPDYAIDEVEVIFKGLCPTCGASGGAAPGIGHQMKVRARKHG
jgi:Fur family ferric uptake transcriptional regulator